MHGLCFASHKGGHRFINCRERGIVDLLDEEDAWRMVVTMDRTKDAHVLGMW